MGRNKIWAILYKLQNMAWLCMQSFSVLTCMVFVIKYLKIWCIGILYKTIMHKMEFGQTYYKYLLKRIWNKFISYFLSFIPFSMYFRILNEFWNSYSKKENQKIKKIVNSIGRSKAPGHGLAGLATRRSTGAHPP
jgi:hypothetical protein